jgi:hypothetical protein
MSATERGFTIFLALFVAVVLAIGAYHYEYSWVVFRFPLAVGAAAIAFAVLHLIRGNRRMTERSEAAPGTARGHIGMPQGGTRDTVVAAAWVIGILPAVVLFGYAIGLTGYVFAYLKTHDESWTFSAVAALGTLAVVYAVFVELLSVPLPLLPIGLG